ncbi:hypothetical protein AVEN_67565-1 [Araneus ventricosus]|uniref:Uncharacterized protein n=1 Tax=Araneus ventricosus TaxID=182803 RepID=A0A4Y2MLU0_ARAVE|nr:hypothetical protein AVEN_67565-1 [Araneus ventricosus]
MKEEHDARENVIVSKWALETKFEKDENVEKLKARIVAKTWNRFIDNWSIVLSFGPIRIAIAYTVENNLSGIRWTDMIAASRAHWWLLSEQQMMMSISEIFKSANKKATLGQDTSNTGSDSSQSEQENINRPRKRARSQQ